MANEEIRGEYQDPRLIGISAPANTMGLGGNAGAMPTQTGIPPVPPPYVGGPTKVFDTLPINGRRFSYDLLFDAGSGIRDLPETETILTARFPLLGPSLPLNGVSFNISGGDTNILAPSPFRVGVQTRGAFVTLVTHYSGKLFLDGQPMKPIPYWLNPVGAGGVANQNSQKFDVSGTVLSEYIFNFADTDGLQPVFIPLATTDTLTALLTFNFTNPDLVPGAPFNLLLHVNVQGVFLLDSGLPVELQISL